MHFFREKIKITSNNKYMYSLPAGTCFEPAVEQFWAKKKTNRPKVTLWLLVNCGL
jgi:hypothetical protein